MKSATRGGHEGMLWRFLVACDPQVDYYIVRDVDTLLGRRDRQTVDEWLASGQNFHIIRDHPCHGSLIQGGLWGGKKQIAGMDSMLENYISNYAGQKIAYGFDQLFLEHCLYRKIRGSVCIHSSWARYPFEFTLPCPPFLPKDERYCIGSHPDQHDRLDDEDITANKENTQVLTSEIQGPLNIPFLLAIISLWEKLRGPRCISRLLPQGYRNFLEKLKYGPRYKCNKLLICADLICTRYGIYPFFAGYKKKKP